MSLFSKIVKKVNDFVANVDPVMRNVPEFEMQKTAFETGNWDKPYGADASAWDFLGAGPSAQVTKGGSPIGGELDPNVAKDRAKGRAVGTLIADYWTAGAFSTIIKPKPAGAPMQLENNGSGLTYGSLASPGTLAIDAPAGAATSSVTPAQATLAQSSADLRRWTWYGVAAIALLFFLKKGLIK